MAAITPDLFSIMCRTCLMQKKIFPIDQVQLEEGTLMDLLQNVIFAEEYREGMPSNMCEECIQEAAVVFKFLVKCKSSNQILKEMLKTKTKDKSEETSVASTPEKALSEDSKHDEKAEEKVESIFGMEPEQSKFKEQDNKESFKVIDTIEEHMKEMFGIDDNLDTNQNAEFEISFESGRATVANDAVIVNETVSSVSNIPKLNNEKIPDKALYQSGQVIHPNHELYIRKPRLKRLISQTNGQTKQPTEDQPEKRKLLFEGEYHEILENQEDNNTKKYKADTDTTTEQEAQNTIEQIECKIETVVEQEIDQEDPPEEEEYVELSVYDEGEDDFPETYENEEEYAEEEEEDQKPEGIPDEQKIYVDPACLECPNDDENIEQNINVLEKPGPKERPQHKVNYTKKMQPIEEIENMCYCCSDCDAPFFTYQELIHHKMEERHKSLQIFVCPECNNKYRRYTLFWEHIQGHMGARTYACYSCNKCFVHKREVQNHINEVHLRTKEFACDECGKVFSRKSNLTTHLKIHAGTYRSVCPSCGETVTPTTLWAHKKRHKKEQENGGAAYQCHICKKIVTTEEILQDHMVRLHGPKTVQCELCEKKCSNEKTLKEHRDFVHSGGRFECKICGNIYKQKPILKDHIRNYHAGETAERYRCGVCHKEFNYKSSLRDHMRTHTGDPKLECKYCGKTCLNNRQYKLHLKTHTRPQKNKDG